jgi:PhoH-like ATPase
VIKDKKLSAFGVRPKNKEQVMAMSALLDDRISLCMMTGRAGTGKTLLAMAAALQKVEDGKYDRIIITRPMSQVGRYELGALPGDVDEKFGPYLENYLTNISQMVGNDRRTAHDLMEQFKIEAMPLQLIRGASWAGAFIIADEVQVLDHHEMLTLGTRIGAESKLVVMGDLNQRDEQIAKAATGLHKVMNDKRMKESPLTSAIELWKCERSKLAKLFADVFEE